MDKYITTALGGLPKVLDDYRWFLGQIVAGNHGIYQAFNNILRGLGDDFIVQGCVVTGSNPNKSLTEGWILLGSELLKVDAIAGTLDTSVNSHYIKAVSFDPAGLKTLLNGSTSDTYQKNRGILQGTSGNLKFDLFNNVPLFELRRIGFRDASATESTKTILRKKIIEIGDWDMDATATVNITHGLPDFTKIRTIFAMIRNDNDLNYITLERTDLVGSTTDGIIDVINTTTIRLSRTTSGFFDNTLHDSTSFNRGWITIDYEI